MWDLYKREPDKSSSDEYESSETDKCSEDMQEIIEKRLHPFHERKIGLQNVGTRGGLVPPIQYETDESMLNKEDDIIKIFIPKNVIAVDWWIYSILLNANLKAKFLLVSLDPTVIIFALLCNLDNFVFFTL